ncbi:unnamed protein product [Phytophthora lilii]|uniref:Unnamed protein product n=1 Tax=Phytophthora lilii TaxID=2077276 RepID=A0A9W6X1Q2_9STRA|nr:unnamed protein product [Phytophthora lilii]
MMSTLSSDSSDLVSLFSDEHTSRLPARFDSAPTSRSEVRSPSSTELSDNSSLTNDDLVVLSDLFGFTNSGSAASTQKPKRATPARPRSHKRPRPTTMALDDGTVLPKSQQQRQKLEIECLKKQVVELQATIENLQARKLGRERQAVERDSSDESYDNSSTPNEWGIDRYQIAAAQKLAEQNEKLRSQVEAHLGQLQQLEQLARTRYLANAFSEQAQLNEHSTSTYYSESC